jgi:hypothetical protein
MAADNQEEKGIWALLATVVNTTKKKKPILFQYNQ